MKSQWVKQGPREYEIRLNGETVEGRLTRYAAVTDRKWQVAYDSPWALIEVVHTPTGQVVDMIERCTSDAASVL
jgi:hypothetical protein